MGLFTKKIEDALEQYPLYSQDGKGRQAVAVCKLELTGTPWAWYVLEGERTEIDEATAKEAGIKAGPTWQLFGIVCSPTTPGGEYGYFLLAELEAIAVSIPIVNADTGDELTRINTQITTDGLFFCETLDKVDGLDCLDLDSDD